MNRNIEIIVAAIILCAVIVCGVIFGYKKYSEKYNIVVGVIAPQTGDQARNAEAMIRGFELAKDEMDSLYHFTIKLKIEDSHDNSISAINAVLKLKGNVEAILGDSRSAVSKAIADEADKENINLIVFSSISTSDNLTSNRNFFRNVPRNELQVEVARSLITKHFMLDKVAIFNKNDEYGNDMSDKFRKISGNLKIVFQESYKDGTTDFRTQIEKIKKTGADVIFTPSNYEETKNLIKQAKEMNLQIPIIGGDDTNDDLIKMAKGYKGGYYFTTFIINEENDYYKHFRCRFMEKYNQKEPQTYDAYAYEAAMILFEAIKNAKNRQTEDICNYLIDNEFNALTGKISFTGRGEVTDRTFGVKCVKNDTITIINP
jgi:branched-chain amino acid transport system substrate-binding protein